jgi:D-glycero-alpha-D-manno-heptose-7-phosphate kinase
MECIIKRVSCPVRIDFGGGTTDLEPYAVTEVGYVLNATINKYVVGELVKTLSGLSLSYHCEVPTASGLGTSGAMNLCWLALVSEETDRKRLAETVYAIERAKGELGGRQDQYASAYGGINFITFTDAAVTVQSVNLGRNVILELERRLVLVYAMEKQLAPTQNRDMLARLAAGDQEWIGLLTEIKDITLQMRDHLERGELDGFGRLLTEEWLRRRRLHKTKTRPELDNFIDHGLRYALGAKVLGSAGGGCVLFYTLNRSILVEHLQAQGGQIIDFNFDFKGLTIQVEKSTTVESQGTVR